MKRIFAILCVALLCMSVLAEKLNKDYLSYIEQYKDIAIREMEEYRIPASITLAQGLLESAAGKSEITIEANNHFGIKCQKNWDGERIYHDDDAKGECFRKYNTALESYEDHSKFLVAGQRYATLFDLASNDYKGWAKGLKSAGYATLPTYAEKLIDIIERYNLDQYDRIIIKGDERKSSSNVKDAKSLPVEKKAPKTVKEEAPVTTPKRSFWDKLFHRNEQPNAAKDSAVAKKQKVYDNGKYIAEISAFRSHEIKEINGVKYVVALPGDTYSSIADEFEMYEKELLKANEVQYGANPAPGDNVFLEKKKSKCDTDTYTAKEGETVYQISQKTGVKVRKLYKLNNLVYGKQINAGDIVKLR